MVNLKKWGITPNFKPKYAEIIIHVYTKKKARFSIMPKNGKSFPLNKKANLPFVFKGKKLTHIVRGNYTIGTNGKRVVLITNGFQVIVEKV